jgi:hypothetical protein
MRVTIIELYVLVVVSNSLIVISVRRYTITFNGNQNLPVLERKPTKSVAGLI